MRQVTRLATLVALLWLVNNPIGSAWAETVVGHNNENRTIVALRVTPAAAQAWVPGPWQVDPIGAGPSKDANFLIVFINPWLVQGPDGKPAAPPIHRRVALVFPAKHPQTGEAAFFVARVYDSNPNAAPGPYKNSIPVATVRVEQTQAGAGTEPGTGSEVWDVRDASGGALEFRFQYQRGVPVRVKSESKPRSTVEPDFYRIYKVDQGVAMVKSVPAGIDRIQQYSLRVTMAELAKLFDGTEEVVSVALVPWYLRQVSLP